MAGTHAEWAIEGLVKFRCHFFGRRLLRCAFPAHGAVRAYDPKIVVVYHVEMAGYLNFYAYERR